MTYLYVRSLNSSPSSIPPKTVPAPRLVEISRQVKKVLPTQESSILLMPHAFHIFVGLCLVHMCLASHPSCKTMPQDPEWPDTHAWRHFNSSVDGRLIRTVPIASVCHGPNYDSGKCGIIRDQWHHSQLQFVILQKCCFCLA